MTSCNVTYDNPLDPMAVVDENTDLASVESLKELIEDAADATEEQYMGEVGPVADIADMLVADLDDALVGCPCNYSLVDMTLLEWQPPTDKSIVFQCLFNFVTFVSDNSPHPNLTELQALPARPTSLPNCRVTTNGDESRGQTDSDFMLDDAEYAACHQDIIDYGIALKIALTGMGVAFEDLCTPTL